MVMNVRFTIRAPLTVLAAIFATLGTSKTASAWSPVQPPTCPTTTNLDWNYRVGGGTGVFDLPSDPNCSPYPSHPCPHYINNLSHNRVFVSNTWVGYVGFHVGSFYTEINYDFLTWGLEGYTPYASASGNDLGAGSVPWVSTGWSFGGIRAVLNFSSDISNTFDGFSLDQIQVCTYLSSPDTHGPNAIDSKKRTVGVLLGTNDVVYLQFAASSSYRYPITLLKDTGEDGSTDFDLFGRCGSLPTPTQHDWVSLSSLAQENFVVKDCNSTVYLAVVSYNGSGVFSVVRGIHPWSHEYNLKAGTNFTATPALMTTFAAQLSGAARELYGRTEGELYIPQIDLYNTGLCDCGGGGFSCNICFMNQAGTGYSDICSINTTKIYQNYFGDVQGLAHELNHLRFCLHDEYYVQNGSTFWQCGHTDMANPWSDNHNICVDLDHKTDTTPNATSSTYNSGMNQAFSAGAAVDSQNTTFDNFSYQNYDFHGNVGVVVTH
jgi:hypothetical protein